MKIGACSSDGGDDRRGGIELCNNKNQSGDEPQTVGGDFRISSNGCCRGSKERENIEGVSLG